MRRQSFVESNAEGVAVLAAIDAADDADSILQSEVVVTGVTQNLAVDDDSRINVDNIVSVCPLNVPSHSGINIERITGCTAREISNVDKPRNGKASNIQFASQVSGISCGKGEHVSVVLPDQRVRTTAAVDRTIQRSVVFKDVEVVARTTAERNNLLEINIVCRATEVRTERP